MTWVLNLALVPVRNTKINFTENTAFQANTSIPIIVFKAKTVMTLLESRLGF